MFAVNILAFAFPIKFQTFKDTEYSIYITLLTESLLATMLLYANINNSKLLVLQTFVDYMEIIQKEEFLKEWEKTKSQEFLAEKLPILPWYKEPVTILICKKYLNTLMTDEITKFQEYLIRASEKMKQERLRKEQENETNTNT